MSNFPECIVQAGSDPVPAVNGVELGSLRRVTPISSNWGFDRGRPIDRYYIENFLALHADAIRGRVLEVGDSAYTRRFGGEHVTTSDVLHVQAGQPQATIIADLTAADHVPANAFDCIILTQTLQLVYDLRAAIRTLYRILKPGGVVLATVPGISHTNDVEWCSSWYWSFTTLSARRLFAEAFLPADVQIQTYGNVLSAISFLHGMAAEELQQEELDFTAPGYEVTIAVRASKTGQSS
jgi:SAM-dependent methyltransferase